MVRANSHLEKIQRDSDIWSDRDGLICLDRNERISAIDNEVFEGMLASLKPEDFSTYPDLRPLYGGLSHATGLSIDCLAVGAGSDGIIRRAFQAFLEAGDVVCAPDPSYRMYEVWAHVFKADFKKVPYGLGPNFSFDVDALIDLIRQGARMCCVANPDQPTGSVLALDDIQKIASAARDANTLLMIDEAYYPFHSESARPLLDEYENILLVRTFSKVGGIAGLRVGYAMGAPNVIQALHKVRGPGEVNAVGAAVATYLLNHPGVMEKFRREVAQGREILLTAAERLGFGSARCAGNFQLLETPPDITPDDLVCEVRRRGYLIRAGFSHPGMEGYVRITLDGPDIIEPFVRVFEEAVRHLRA